ncbi:flavin reductase family protein [Streptomyces marokkonensis]|uniref:Flavin reductase family protein n=1 Tax=Streptomyces marokkonensis TaxID=324855 RepID=A0ABP7R6N9_9ACTN
MPATAFTAALRRHASGVTAITGRGPSGPVGFAATSFTSVSLSPPLVSFCVGVGSRSWAALRAADHFGVNVLSSRQSQLSDRFSRTDVDRFADIGWWEGHAGVPLLEGTCASLACRRWSVLPLGDHMLVVGLVVQAHTGSADDSPLLYHEKRYGRPASLHGPEGTGRAATPRPSVLPC